MSITGPGSITAASVMAQNNMMNQLNTLGEQLASGQAAQTYSGLQSQAGVALALNAQLSAITGYSNTATTVGTTLSVAQSVLTQLGDAGTAVQQAINQQGAFTLNNNGQTTTQAAAASQLDSILSLLNTQVGDNYIFSGSGQNQPSVASASDILNGNGAQAGLTQVISERQQADLGVSGLGHLSVAVGALGFHRHAQSGRHAVRLSAYRRGFQPDRRDRHRAIGLPGVDLGRSRVQSEFRRLDPIPAHASGWLDPDHFAAGDDEFAAGRKPVHHRHVALGHRDQSANGPDLRHHRSDADGAAGRLRDGRRQ